nr:glycine zipper 2TM domain-containing protein [uncultured Rhodoferax sp.]
MVKRPHLQAVLLCAAALGSVASGAQEVGRVISSQAVIQQVAVPRQVCSTQQVEVQPPKSGAGAAIGAITGAVVGSAAGGRGPGQAAATAVGAVAGAILGDKVEGTPDTQVKTVQNCQIQNVYENRTVAYNVVYEYGGKQYSVQLPQDPGPTIALQVTPVGSTTATPASPAVITSTPVIVQPVVMDTPVVVPRVYFPYFWGWDDGPRGHHHRR